MTEDNNMNIVTITRRQGRFNVSLRWRDIPLQKECNNLVRQGLLRKVGRIKRSIVYVLPETRYQVKNGYLIIEKLSEPERVKPLR